MSQEDAKTKYVALLKEMLEAAGDKERVAELEA
jgi:acyl-CoA-binding protein